jgi:fibronectin-binding autotransporter adhesin
MSRTLQALRLIFGAAVIAVTPLTNSFAADFSSVWSGGNGNWSNGTLWSTNPNYPNNTGAVTYDATINGGTVTLDRNITIQRFFFNGNVNSGILNGAFQLTLNEGLTWTGGEIALSPGGAINLTAGSTSTISSSFGSFTDLASGTINNAGNVSLAQNSALFGGSGIINNLAGGSWTLQSGSELGNFGVFNNAGSFNVLDDPNVGFSPFVDCVFNNSGTVTLQSGHAYDFALYEGGSASGSFIVPTQVSLRFDTFSTGNTYTLTSGASITGGGSAIVAGGVRLNIAGNSTIGTSLTNNGLLTVASGATLSLNGSFNQTGITRLNGGTITSALPLIFQSGTLGGAGTINSNISLSANAILAFQLGGKVAGSGANNYDSLIVNGSFALAGANLDLFFKNNFENSINGSDNFTLLTTSSGLTGSFGNVVSGGRLDTVDGFGSFIVSYGGSNVSLTNFVPNTRWLGGNGNWTNGTNWSSSPAFPNNDASTHYSVVIQSGTVSLDTNITISRFLLTGGNLAGGNTLTVNDRFIWTAGAISGSPGSSIDLGAGSTSTISYLSLPALRPLNGRILNNAGTVNQDANIGGSGWIINNLAGGTWNLSASLGEPPSTQYTFNNAGTLVATGRPNISDFDGMGAVFNNSGAVELQAGAGGTFGLTLNNGGTTSGSFTLGERTTLEFIGSASNLQYSLLSGSTINGAGEVQVGGLNVAGSSTIGASLKVFGALVVQSGATLTLNGSFTQSLSDSLTRLSGGTITSSQPLTFQTGTLAGSGTVQASVNNNGTISPGASAGTLTINGNLSLLNNSKIVMEIGGISQGTQYDHLAISGTVGLDGTLELDMLNGFESQLAAGQTFTLLSSDSLLTGAFDNVANGARLTAADGKASFRVNYGPGSLFDPDDLVLSDPEIVPEPASLLLFAIGTIALGFFQFRRR